MARLTFRQKLNLIRSRNGRGITSYKFIYNMDSALTHKTNKVYIWLLINCRSFGDSITELKIHRRDLKTPEQWAQFIRGEWLEPIFINRILPAYTEKSKNNFLYPDDDWKLSKFIGYGLKPAFRYDIRKSGNPVGSNRRNKTAKKG